MQSACAWASICCEADDAMARAAFLSVALPSHPHDATPSSSRLPSVPRYHFVLLCSSVSLDALQ
jgi:hypothetical protein